MCREVEGPMTSSINCPPLCSKRSTSCLLRGQFTTPVRARRRAATASYAATACRATAGQLSDRSKCWRTRARAACRSPAAAAISAFASWPASSPARGCWPFRSRDRAERRNVGDDRQRTAGVRFEQRVAAAFVMAAEHEEIAGAVERGEPLVRHTARQTHPADSTRDCSILERTSCSRSPPANTMFNVRFGRSLAARSTPARIVSGSCSRRAGRPTAPPDHRQCRSSPVRPR